MQALPGSLRVFNEAGKSIRQGHHQTTIILGITLSRGINLAQIFLFHWCCTLGGCFLGFGIGSGSRSRGFDLSPFGSAFSPNSVPFTLAETVNSLAEDLVAIPSRIVGGFLCLTQGIVVIIVQAGRFGRNFLLNLGADMLLVATAHDFFTSIALNDMDVPATRLGQISNGLRTTTRDNTLQDNGIPLDPVNECQALNQHICYNACITSSSQRSLQGSTTSRQWYIASFLGL